LTLANKQKNLMFINNVFYYLHQNQPKFKKLVHWMLIPKGQARPRTWVKV
jgi:hypothetical protein